jgi:hypothetical protein
MVDAIVNGKAILIEGGNYRTGKMLKYCCRHCKSSCQKPVVDKLVKLFQPVRDGKCEVIGGDTPEEAGAKLALKLRESKIL